MQNHLKRSPHPELSVSTVFRNRKQSLKLVLPEIAVSGNWGIIKEHRCLAAVLIRTIPRRSNQGIIVTGKLESVYLLLCILLGLLLRFPHCQIRIKRLFSPIVDGPHPESIRIPISSAIKRTVSFIVSSPKTPEDYLGYFIIAQSYVKSSYFLFAWFPFFHYSSIRMRWISCDFRLRCRFRSKLH